ncbi:acyltransferase family protein [Rhodococcus sp. NBC_00294]|uniref:acyltransferase family protein n=1 Tax=Rhodococcus sp. NBC_00294 TaxID=2976004 RepID=UPI002E27AE99|nr:acyltransferase [Rhodococcus sp. NBC_00294]
MTSSTPDSDGGVVSVRTAADPPRIRFGGVDILRALAVLTVVYSHISYFLVDDLGTPWWLIDVVTLVFVEHGGLNHHLSFVGVAFFMILTGLVATASVVRNSPRAFLVGRAARLLPVFWLSVLAAIVLVRLGVNGMFSQTVGISNAEAAMSFVLGGFFVRPEVVVLGVTWTLVVQGVFYVYAVCMRRVLASRPVLVPVVGAAVCWLILLYTDLVPYEYTIPMVDKVAATLPTVFLGQIVYLAFARLASWRALLLAGLAQFAVIRYATTVDAFHVGQQGHLWTVLVLVVAVVLVAPTDTAFGRSRVIHWLATRSYTIYLVHTLVLYRIYSLVEPHLGATVAVLVFALITGVLSDLVYRYVETPAARWIARHWSGHPRTPAPTANEPTSSDPTSGPQAS